MSFRSSPWRKPTKNLSLTTSKIYKMAAVFISKSENKIDFFLSKYIDWFALWPNVGNIIFIHTNMYYILYDCLNIVEFMVYWERNSQLCTNFQFNYLIFFLILGHSWHKSTLLHNCSITTGQADHKYFLAVCLGG